MLTVVIGVVLRGSSFVAQAGLKFATICLPLPEFAMPGSLFIFLSLSLPPTTGILPCFLPAHLLLAHGFPQLIGEETYQDTATSYWPNSK